MCVCVCGGGWGGEGVLSSCRLRLIRASLYEAVQPVFGIFFIKRKEFTRRVKNLNLRQRHRKRIQIPKFIRSRKEIAQKVHVNVSLISQSQLIIFDSNTSKTN